MAAVTGILLITFYASYYVAMLFAVKRPTEKVAGQKQVFRQVSVIIPTYNEERNISAKIENVLKQSYLKNFTEIIVMDGASTDNTIKIANDLANKVRGVVPMRVLTIDERRGKSHQINIALIEARGEIIVTTDADVLLDPDAVARLIGHFDDEHVGAVSARQSLIKGRSIQTDFEQQYRDIYEIMRQGESNLHSTPIFHGGLCAFRTAIVKPIREDLNADDSQLAIQAIRGGLRALYEPSSVFYAYAPQVTRSAWWQRVRRGQGLVRTFLYNSDMLFRRRFGSYGCFIFPAEFFMHIVSPILTLMFIAASIGSVAAFLSDFVLTPLLPAIAVLVAIMLGIVMVSRLEKRPLSGTWALIPSFVIYQLALFTAMLMFLAGKRLYIWRKLDEGTTRVADLNHRRRPRAEI